jgi:hypothetical protein
MPSNETPYRVFRRRGPMVPALFLGLLQIAVGIDTLFTHLVLPASQSVLTTIASVMFLILGSLMILFVGVSLARPEAVIEATSDGLALSITGPGKAPVRIPWNALKSVEIGRAGPDASRKGDPLCLIVRFSGARVSRPATLVGVYHSTKGSIYIRASHLPRIEPIVERLTALMRERQAK